MRLGSRMDATGNLMRFSLLHAMDTHPSINHSSGSHGEVRQAPESPAAQHDGDQAATTAWANATVATATPHARLFWTQSSKRNVALSTRPVPLPPYSTTPPTARPGLFRTKAPMVGQHPHLLWTCPH